ncbi:hypothetical protein ACFSW8_03765 [Rubritalea tangerina]|uniref:DUF4136 domain-containing protein n=2 Tax=Rubritalea tangerina TaxID=430798 RepID=A0ABW4Z8Y9_9BACT
MQHLLKIGILLILSGSPILASIQFGIPDPQTALEDLSSTIGKNIQGEAFPSVTRDPNIATYNISKENRNKFVAPHKESFRKLTSEIRRLDEAQLKAAFGLPITLDKSYIIPLSGTAGVGFSGLGYQGKSEYYFLQLVDLGALIIFPRGDGKFVSGVAIYLKKDGQYIHRPTPENLGPRIEWEQNKFKLISKLINQLGEQDAAPNR